MLRILRVSKSYGSRAVLREASFEVRPGERVGLVGANGAGKTTLLDIIRGTLEPDGGQVVLAPGWRIGYLAQDSGLDPTWTVRRSMWSVFDAIIAGQRELAEVEERLRSLPASDSETMSLVERQADLHEAFDRLGGHTVEAEIGKVLHGLGFSEVEAERSVGSFSGGWQVRIALARLLLGSADVLLLDEPTNHLDLTAVDWLEDYLTSRPRTCLIVSHDRYFLDKVTTRTLELENNVVTSYAGGYRRYVEEKERRLAALEATYQQQQEFLETQRTNLERFRAKATKASFVQSREKALAKIESVDPPKRERPPVFKFTNVPESGREVLHIKHLYKRYGDLQVLADVDFRIEKGDRVGLLGSNGAGKSTLLRLLARLEEPEAGNLHWGHNVRVGYFAQNAAEVLDINERVFDSVRAVAPLALSDTDVRSLLGRFLFRGDDAFKKIRVLSGGERNRVALARLLARPYNMLLLDEPTNHLDIPSREALQAALSAYPGTLVLVTHDRYLVDRIASRIVSVAEGQATVYDGDYSYYRRKLAEPSVAAAQVVPDPIVAPTRGRQPGREVGRRVQRGAAQMARSLSAVETLLGERESRKAEIENELADPDTYRDPNLAAELLDEHARIEKEIEDLVERWGELAEEAG